MRYAKIAAYVLVGLTGVFLLVAVIDVFRLRGGGTSLFHGPVSILLLAAGAIALIVSLAMKKPELSAYGIGYYLLHGGLLIFLAGAFLFRVSGVSITAAVPIDATATYSQIQTESGEFIPLGFDVGISDFLTEYYDLTEDGIGGPKYYEATLMLQDHNGGKMRTVPLIVNKPVRENGWKILLMGYSDERNAATLLFKKDNGEILSLIGAGASILGAFLMCVLRRRKAGAAI